jgi:hypothetical protein
MSACSLGGVPVAGTTPPAPPTECTAAQHSWNGYHLPLPHGTPGPFVVSVLNTSGYPFDLSLLNRPGSPVLYKMGGGGFPMNIVRVDKPGAGWLGIVTVSIDGADHIRSAEVQINGVLIATYGDLGIARVMCQEGAHGAGLGHQRNVEDSCMDDCQERRGSFRACLTNGAAGLNAHDFAELDRIYAHAVVAKPPPPPCAGQGARTIVLHRFMAPGHLAEDH